MGKIVNNPITSSFSGKFSDDLVFRRVGSRTIFARKGENTKPASPAQTSNRHRFAEAQVYTRHLLEQPELSERYAIMAKLNGFYSAQVAAVKDFMCLPEIDSVVIKKHKDKAGNVILIKPKILLKIQRMEVSLYHANGSVLESGSAVKTELNWKYTIALNQHVEGSRLEVVAYDGFDKSCTFTQLLY